MGLAEKRAITGIQQNEWPKMQKEIETAAGYAVTVQVDWDLLSVADSAHLYQEGIRKVFVEPVVNSFKSICSDDMGKKALQASLQKILFTNSRDIYSPESGITFSAGELRIDHSPVANMDDVDARTQYIQSMLEKAL